MDENQTPVQQATARIKTFVSKHKTALAVAATATVAVVAHRQTVKAWDKFLTEKDLLEEFYSRNSANDF